MKRDVRRLLHDNQYAPCQCILSLDIGAKRLELVGPPAPHAVQVLTKDGRLDSGQWLYAAYASADSMIELPALGGSIRVADVYDDVNLDEGRGPG